jgi:hypothetical protein
MSETGQFVWTVSESGFCCGGIARTWPNSVRGSTGLSVRIWNHAVMVYLACSVSTKPICTSIFVLQTFKHTVQYYWCVAYYIC